MEKSNANRAKGKLVNEGFSGANINEDKSSSTPELKKEVEKDDEGNVELVERARHVAKKEEDSKRAPKVGHPTESIHQTPETATHKDFNSNPNPEEFPDKNHKNQENKGNIEE